MVLFFSGNIKFLTYHVMSPLLGYVVWHFITKLRCTTNSFTILYHNVMWIDCFSTSIVFLVTFYAALYFSFLH